MPPREIIEPHERKPFTRCCLDTTRELILPQRDADVNEIPLTRGFIRDVTIEG
jgi:hypothetical protein